nr:response regulator transcription factor [Flavobacteriales bacterium]
VLICKSKKNIQKSKEGINFIIKPTTEAELKRQIMKAAGKSENNINQESNSVCDKIVKFSLREKQILQLIADGNTNKKIAEILILSKRTIETHRNRILLKSNAKNTANLISFGIKKGWIEMSR